MKQDLNHWTTLPPTLIGRVEAVRMNVLPRLVFLFQTLPISPPKSTFGLIDRLISRFIWQSRGPRVRYKVLQLATTKGGLGLPNLKHYWLASQLRAMIVWLSDDTSTRWLRMEKSYSPDMPLAGIPFNRIKSTRDLLGEWSNTTCVAWKEIQQMFKLTGDLSVLSSITYIGDF